MPKWQIQLSSCHKEESKQEQIPFREGILYLSVIMIKDMPPLFLPNRPSHYRPVILFPDHPID